MIEEHHWEGEKPSPEEYFGFVYIICCNIDNTKYVGKKQYWVSRPGIKGCKSKCTDKSSPKWKDVCWKESDWRKYTGSSRDFNKHIEKYGEESFTFTILSQHKTKGNLHYAEIQEQVYRDVLGKKLPNGEYEYFNRQIAAIKFRPSTSWSDEQRSKIKGRESALLKAGNTQKRLKKG